jgi:hypothetical protein
MNLQRYNFIVDRSWNVAEPSEHVAGEYVKWVDVEGLVTKYLQNLVELDKLKESETYRIAAVEEDEEIFRVASEQIKQLHANCSATEAQRQKIMAELKVEKERLRRILSALETLRSC